MVTQMEEQKSGFWGTLFNLMNSIIGAGMLTMPLAFTNGGWLFSLFCLVTIGTALSYTYYLMAFIAVDFDKYTISDETSVIKLQDDVGESSDSKETKIEIEKSSNKLTEVSNRKVVETIPVVTSELISGQLVEDSSSSSSSASDENSQYHGDITNQNTVINFPLPAESVQKENPVPLIVLKLHIVDQHTDDTSIVKVSLFPRSEEASTVSSPQLSINPEPANADDYNRLNADSSSKNTNDLSHTADYYSICRFYIPNIVLGKLFGWICEFCVFLFGFGCLLGYVVILGQTSTPLFDFWLGKGTILGNAAFTTGIIMLFIVFPLCLLKNLKVLSVVSTLSMVSVATLLILLFFTLLSEWSRPHGNVPYSLPALGSHLPSILSSLSLFSFSIDRKSVV